MISKREFVTAGNAYFTVTSKVTGVSYTYRVAGSESKIGAGIVHFVAVLNGPDNNRDYAFIGTIFADGTFRHGKKSQIGYDAPSVVAFDWIWRHIDDADLDERAEFRHAGKCCRCARKLTTVASIDLGIGPECLKKVG